MKLKKLTIHNIASFENAEINFDQKPLADSDVFLITGNTGAGKSTILDAICLALYANTPRLNSTNMQGETQDGDRCVRIDDPRQLMRRNTGEASVTLTFEGSNGVNYQATWSVARARRNVTGNIQSKSWELKNLDDDITYSKDNEIRAEIHSAIGLDFNQFRRITMLPQGEFTRFLNSPDNEKAEILEKITGVDVYSKIGKKIYETTAQKRQEWEDAQRLVNGVQTLSDDELEKKNKELKQITGQCDTLKKEQDIVNNKRQWLKDYDDLTQKRDNAKNEHQRALEEVSSDDYKTKERLLKDWNDTAEARNKLAGLEEAKRQKSTEENALNALSKEFETLLGGQQYSKDELQRLENEKVAVDKYIEDNQSKKNVYANVQTIAGHLNTISSGRSNIADNEARRRNGEKKLKEVLTPAQQQADEMAKTAKKILEQKESELNNQAEELKKMDLPTLRNLRDKAKDLLSKIVSAKDKIDALDNAKSEIQKRRTQNDSLKGQIDKNQNDSNELASQIHDAKIKKDTREEDLVKQRDTVDKFAKALRANLQKGDICPVCQQKIASELPQEAELSTMVSGLQKLYDDAKKKYDDLVNDKNRLDAQIKADTDIYNREKNAIDNDKSIADAERKALAACSACGINAMDLDALNDLQSNTNDRLSESDNKIISGEAQEKVVGNLRDEVEEQRNQKETAEDALRKANKAVDDCKNEISTIQQLIASKKKDVTSAEKAVETLLTGTFWDIDWNKETDSFGNALTNAANLYNSAVAKQMDLVNSIKTKKKEIDDVAEALNRILDAMPVWRGIVASTTNRVDSLLSKTNNLAQKVAAANSKLGTSIDLIDRDNKWLDVFLIDNNISRERLDELSKCTATYIKTLDGSLQQAKNNEVEKNAKLDVAQNALAKHNNNKPALNNNDTIVSLDNLLQSITNQISDLNQQIGAINKELNDDATNKAKLGQLMKDVDDKLAIYQKWSRLNELIGDATGSKFRKIAQSYVLANLVHSANGYMSTLTDRYTLKVIPGTFVILVEDAYQGFASRAASTISGGESFLVSLSLALALSDIGDNLSVDTIFIDEGFGTLSGDSLQMAIDTLRSLHTKAGRNVGIISHVEELRVNIPVQIQVIQNNKTGCSEINIIPKANSTTASNKVVSGSNNTGGYSSIYDWGRNPSSHIISKELGEQIRKNAKEVRLSNGKTILCSFPPKDDK